MSLLPDSNVPLEKVLLERISMLVGHKRNLVTEVVHRQPMRPELQDGAEVMDRIFGWGAK